MVLYQFKHSHCVAGSRCQICEHASIILPRIYQHISHLHTCMACKKIRILPQVPFLHAAQELAIVAMSLLSLSGTSAFQLAGLASHAGTKSGVAMALASRRCPLMRAHTYAHTLTPLPHSGRCGRGRGVVRKTGAMGMSASVSLAIITTAVIFPAQSIKVCVCVCVCNSKGGGCCFI